MSVSPSIIAENLLQVNSRIVSACARVGRSSETVRLVAVSKTKSTEHVIAAYGAGQRTFGENYVQELLTKSSDTSLLSACPEIRWHFIGAIQSNKISKIVSVQNLSVVETISSEKHAKLFNDAWGQTGASPLSAMIQVNTSQEDQKQGLNTEGAIELAEFITDNCPHLVLKGFMTIGAIDLEHDNEKFGPNPDFVSLVDVRAKFSAKRSVSVDSLELSMGMSNDFEHAIALGSTNVRVGSIIFGSR